MKSTQTQGVDQTVAKRNDPVS